MPSTASNPSSAAMMSRSRKFPRTKLTRLPNGANLVRANSSASPSWSMQSRRPSAPIASAMAALCPPAPAVQSM